MPEGRPGNLAGLRSLGYPDEALCLEFDKFAIRIYVRVLPVANLVANQRDLFECRLEVAL
eukprot:1195323-Prorocentrum_minimum.AAC.11